MIPQLGSIWIDSNGRRVQVERIQNRDPEVSPPIVVLRVLNPGPRQLRWTRMGSHNFNPFMSKGLRLEKAAKDMLVQVDPQADIEEILAACRRSGFRGFAVPRLHHLIGTAMDSKAISFVSGVCLVVTDQDLKPSPTELSLEACESESTSEA